MSEATQPRRVGDRRTHKRHGPQIRVERMARDKYGRPLGRIEEDGQPTYGWRTLLEVDPWDYGLLTTVERSQLRQRQLELWPDQFAP